MRAADVKITQFIAATPKTTPAAITIPSTNSVICFV